MVRRVLVKLLPPGNRPGHEDTPAYRSNDVAIDAEATARGATGPGTGHGLIDPVRAVTAVLPAEQPRAAQTARAAPSGGSARTIALAAIAGAFGLLVVVLTVVLVIRRRQRARPSGSAAGPPAGPDGPSGWYAG